MLGALSTSPSPQFCPHLVATSRARADPQPGQVLTFLFVVGDVFQQLSLHAAVFPWLSLTQHCSLWRGRKNRNIRLELSAQTHGAFKRRDNHGHILFTARPKLPLQNKAARKLPPRHRSQIKHGKAGPGLTARGAQGL